MINPDFEEIVSGWLLVDDFYDLTDRIERLAELATKRPLTEQEEKVVKLMIKTQIAKGIVRGDFAPYITDPDILK